MGFDIGLQAEGFTRDDAAGNALEFERRQIIEPVMEEGWRRFFELCRQRHPGLNAVQRAVFGARARNVRNG